MSAVTVGQKCFWMSHDGVVMSGILKSTSGDGLHAEAQVKLDASFGGGMTNVKVYNIRPNKTAAEAGRSAKPEGRSHLGRAYMPARRATAPAPQPVTNEQLLAVLERILAAVSPDEEEWSPLNPDGSLNPVIPDAPGLAHDVMGGTGPGGKIKTFVRSTKDQP